MADWTATLSRIDAATQKLRSLIERFLVDGDPAGVKEACEAVLQEIPADVVGRPQHPLTVTSKALKGTLRQALEGRALFRDVPAPEWWSVLEDGLMDALVDFERELAVLLGEGEPRH